MNARPPPVPGRDCGECVGCCLYLVIDTPELQSQPGVLCHNWKGHGCSIYETRPSTCRDYLCGWRLFAHFDDSWRPDLSGVLITVVNGQSPEGYLQEGMELLITHTEKALGHPQFFPFLARAASARIPLFLTFSAAPGFVRSRLFINPFLEDQAHAGNEAGLRTIFEAAMQRILLETTQPAMLKHKKGQGG